MTIDNAEKSPLIYARVAGLAYLITIMLGIFSANFVYSKLVVPGNVSETVNNILENESLFRVGLASEILMFVLVVLLAMSLYVILKTVDKNLALLALLWRAGEAIIGAGVTVISGSIPLLLLNGESMLEAKELHALVGMFLEVRNAGLDIVLIFIGMGGTIFFYLFYKSNYIPRILSAWGMLTYLSMLILSFASVLFYIPAATKLAIYAPGGLFEILIGFWLLFKGVNIEQWEKHAKESN